MPADKSISHRALIVGALSGGPATVTIRSPGRDVRSTVHALGALGVAILEDGDRFEIQGLPGRDATLDCGNSGTTMRLLAGALAGLDVRATLDGDDSLRARPMERVAALLRAAGAEATTSDGHAPITVVGRPPLSGVSHHLPVASAQLLGAAIVAGAVHPDAELTIEGVCINPTRLAIVALLRRMGADIEVTATDEVGPELVGEITVRGGPPLRSVRVEGDEVAELIDELPLVAIAMASATGESEVCDAAELRVKESDRIATVVAGLDAIGAEVAELPDGWRVRRGTPCEARVETRGDHRIAIAFAVAAATGLAASVELDDPACTSVSYPAFWDDLATVSG